MKTPLLVLSLIMASVCFAEDSAPDPLHVLAISKTIGFRHESIPNAIKAFSEMARESNWSITFTEDSSFVEDQVLSRMDAVVLIMTTGDIFSPAQQQSIERFVTSGGGLVGIHSGGTDTEYEWEWFREVIGARFTGHPPVCKGTLIVEDPSHASTRHFESDRVAWEDEFYSFDRSPREDVHVLLSIDESSYDTSNNPWFKGVDLKMGDHPMAWLREIEAGRVFQTALGHTIEIYDDPAFRKHLIGAVQWAGKRE